MSAETMDVRYRVAGPDDLGAVQLLRQALYIEDDNNGDIHQDWPSSEDGREELRPRLTGEPEKGVCYVAETGPRGMEKIVAYVLGGPKEKSSARAKSWIELEEVYVDPDARRRGIAERLCNMLEAWRITEGADTTLVRVFAINEAAIALYKKLGYVPNVISMRYDPSQSTFRGSKRIIEA